MNLAKELEKLGFPLVLSGIRNKESKFKTRYKWVSFPHLYIIVIVSEKNNLYGETGTITQDD